MERSRAQRNRHDGRAGWSVQAQPGTLTGGPAAGQRVPLPSVGFVLSGRLPVPEGKVLSIVLITCLDTIELNCRKIKRVFHFRVWVFVFSAQALIRKKV